MGDKGTDETLLAPGPPRASDPVPHATNPSLPADLLARPAPAAAPAPDYDDLVVVDPGHYAIVKELARGGMGRILEARDRRLGRRVAIKEVMHHDETALARFEREARITARLQHPAIVHVHEAGRWPSGQPFYAMKLIRGKPLDARIAGAGSLAKRLELLPSVIAVADALAFAHSEGVIHRDLKPANVLVGDFGETVVIDWGIAKDLVATSDDDLPIGPYRRAAREGETIEGAIIGTPAYMPPEQAAGERVDARADVYSLGALLYQVLAGAPPYEGKTTAEVLDRVLEHAPQPLAEREPDAPVDLVAIADKAMARDPADRFPTAKEMVAELKRFQTGQLVTSRRYSRWDLARRWLRRYRAAVAVGAIALGTLAAIAIAGVSRIVDERNRADHEAVLARERADEGTLVEARAALAADPSSALALLKRMGPGAELWRDARMIASDAAARGVADHLHGRPATLLVWGPRVLAAYEEDDGNVRVWDPRAHTSRIVAVGPGLRDLRVPDDDTLVAVDDAGVVRRWTIATGASAQVFAITGLDERAGISISPDAARVVALAYREPARLVDLRTGTTRRLRDYQNASWAPDGSRLALLDRDNAVDLLDPASAGEPRRIGTLDNLTRQIVTDGTRVWNVTFDRDAAIHQEMPWRRIHEMTTGYSQLLPRPIGQVAAMPGGRLASVAAAMTTWDTTLGAHERGRTIRFDAKQLFASDNLITITDGTAATLRLAGDIQTSALATAADGRIASADHDGTIRVWHLPVVVRRHGDGQTSTSAALVTADHATLVMTRLGPALEVRDLATGAQQRIEVTAYPEGVKPPSVGFAMRIMDVGGRRFSEDVNGPAEEVIVLVGSRTGRRLASIDEAGALVVWDLDARTGRMLDGHAEHVAISPDGTRVASSHKDDVAYRLVVWDVATGKPSELATGMPATALAFGPDHQLAVTTLTGGVHVFDAAGRARHLARADEGYRSVAFSADGTQLIAAGDAWAVRIWRLDTLASRKLTGHSGTIIGLQADGDRVASISADHTVRVWNLATGAVVPLVGHAGLVTSVAFGPDDTVVTGSEDHTARLWDLRTGHSRALEGHADAIVYAGHLDPHTIVVVDKLRQVAEYPDVLPRDEPLLRAWLEGATNLTK